MESELEAAAGDLPVAFASARKPLLAVVGRGLGVMSAFLVNAVIARLMPAGAFSDFQLLLTLLTPVSWIAVLGLNSSAVRLIGEETAREGTASAIELTRQMLRIAATSALLSMPLWWILLWVGTHYLGFPLPGDALLLAVFVVTVALIGFQQVVADCFFGHHEVAVAPLFTGGLMAGPVSTLLFLGLFVGWAYVSRGDQAEASYTAQGLGVALHLRYPTLLQAISVLLMALCISLPIASVVLRRMFQALAPAPVPARRAVDFARISKVGFAMLGLSISAYFLTVLVDVWIAGKMFRDAAGVASVELDWYIAARRLTFMAFITLQLAGSLAAPGAALLYFSGKQAELQTLLRRYAWYGGLPALIAVTILLAVPHFMLTSYLGPRFGEAASVVRILAIAPLFAAWAGPGGYALAVTGHQNYSIVVSLLAGLFVVVAGFPAAVHWELHGLAVVSVIAFIVKHGAEWILARRLLGVWCHMY